MCTGTQRGTLSINQLHTIYIYICMDVAQNEKKQTYSSVLLSHIVLME